MNNLLLILFTFFLISFKEQEECEIMKSEAFLVEAESTTVLGHKIKVNGESFQITERSGVVRSEEFYWMDNCTFLLEDRGTTKVLENEIEKAVNSGGPIYYQITKVDGDTLYFIMTRNLHIQLDSGKLIRLDD